MTDKDYEILAYNIHQALLKAEGHDTIEIKHNVKISGRSGQEHQIDVYWKFTVAGVVHQTAIECKKYKSSISVGRVRDFSAALDDIGNINGVMVTTEGYQSGAEQFASHKGIKLLILRSPRDRDLAGLIRKVVFQLIAAFRNVVSLNIQISDDWIATNRNLLTTENVQISGMSNEIGLCDADGTLVRSWWEVENALPVADSEGKPLPRDTTVSHKLDVTGLYIPVPGVGLAPLKLVEFKYVITEFRQESHIKPSSDPSYVMRDTKSGEQHLFFMQDGQINVKPSNNS